MILISPSDCSLLVHRNMTYFFMLILLPATFLNELITSSCFFVDSLGFSIYKIMLPANINNLTFYLVSFFLPSCTTCTCLNRGSESGHFCLIPNLTWKIFNPSLLNMRLTMGFCIYLIICCKMSLLNPVDCFVLKGWWLCQMLILQTNMIFLNSETRPRAQLVLLFILR